MTREEKSATDVKYITFSVCKFVWGRTKNATKGGRSGRNRAARMKKVHPLFRGPLLQTGIDSWVA